MEENKWPSTSVVLRMAYERARSVDEAFNATRHNLGVLLGTGAAVTALAVSLSKSGWDLFAIVPGFVALWMVGGGLWEVEWSTAPELKLSLTREQPTALEYSILESLEAAEVANVDTLDGMQSALRAGLVFLAIQLAALSVISIVRVATAAS